MATTGSVEKIESVDEAISVYDRLWNAAINATESYVNNRPAIKYKCRGCPSDIVLLLKEILLLGAITCSDCLLTGKTGSGKTRLAGLVLAGLFGPDGFVNKTITPAMEPSHFLDVDYSGIIKGDKSLKQALEPSPMFNVPAMVLNEANRAPAMVQNYLIPLLDREMEIEGEHFSLGLKIDKRLYQYRILTINEGDSYAVTAMDQALRDRSVITVPLDAFYQGVDDCHVMLRQMERGIETTSISTVENESDCTKEVLGLWLSLPELIPVSAEARSTLVYLSGLSYCHMVKEMGVNPPVKEILLFDSGLCRKHNCQYAASTHLNPEGNLCGAIQAPSQRSLRAMLLTARGIALARMHKEKDSPPEVVPEDIWAIAPFVLYRKLGLSHEWLSRFGNAEWIGLRQALKGVQKRWESLPEGLRKGDIDSISMDELEEYSKRNCDFWVMRFKDTSL